MLAASAMALTAAPINPEAHKRIYEEKSKTAEVVALVRVVAATCTEAEGEPGNRAVTLQLSLQVLEVEKGPVKKNELLVVPHKVTLPAGPGPRSYGYMAALRQFPFPPGVKGHVALNWDKEKRTYTVVAGWVPEPVGSNAAIPTEVGKTFAAGDADKPK
jgi:hypothetical protein